MENKMRNNIMILLAAIGFCSSVIATNGVTADGAGTGGTETTAATIRNVITGRQIIKASVEAAKCLINKQPGTDEEKAAKITRQMEMNEKRIKIQEIKYDNDCTINDRNILFDHENCILEACKSLADGRSEKQIRNTISETCAHAIDMTSKVSPKCLKSILYSIQ